MVLPKYYAAPLCMAVLLALFLLVDIPPLVDIPGHIGAAAIANAASGSPLLDYYRWHWSFIPNMGGEVLMALLARPLGVEAAGWWSALIATTCLALGGLAVIRSLNPKGAHGWGWAMMFVFGFPWVWGFLNFILATGFSLLIFAASIKMQTKPARRALLLLIVQPLVLMCHAVGGLILPVLVAAEALGRSLDARGKGAAPSMAGLAREVWPLTATALFMVFWQALSPAAQTHRPQWDWLGKLDFLMEALRDQSFVFDIASVVVSYLLILFCTLLGAGRTWRRGLPALALFLLYALAPARINGSELVDLRLLPVVMLLALGLQDWSAARSRIGRAVAFTGGAFLFLRLALIAWSFTNYQTSYKHELAAIDHMRSGGKVFVLREQSCSNVQWRMSRLDTLPALASLKKQVWINSHWTVAGLHMLSSRYDPLPNDNRDVSPMIWDQRCPDSDGKSLETRLAEAPLKSFDYVWLVDLGRPTTLPAGLALTWHSGRSALYEIRR